MPAEIKHGMVNYMYTLLIFIWFYSESKIKMAEGGVTVKQEPVEAVELESRFAVLCNRSYQSPVSVKDWKISNLH